MRLLVVEDDVNIAGLVADALRAEGHRVDTVENASDAAYAARSIAYEILIVDRALPDQDGLQLVRQLRGGGIAVPILMLTARGAIDDRVAGLGAGADDYLVKPFALPELKARIQALSRRPPQLDRRVVTVANIEFDVERRAAQVDGQPLALSRRELGLLELFLRRANHVLPKTSIQESLYGFDDELASNAVEVHIHHLRKLLAKSGARVRIETRRGIGYCLSPAAGEAAPPSPPSDEDIAERAVAFQRQAFVARARRDADRLTALFQTLPNVTGPSAVQAAVEEIEGLAHGLAGAAGVFGFEAVGEAAAPVVDIIRTRRETEASGIGDLPGALARLLAALQRMNG